MPFSEHVASFEGKPVVNYRPGMTLDPESSYRIRWDYDDEEDFDELFSQFISSDGVDRITGLLTGSYAEEMFEETDSMASVIETVIGAADQLPSLTGLFLGDITFEENEISWIWQSDISPIWNAYPRLQTLVVRGAQGLSLGEVVHDQLRTLILQSGGLPTEIIQQVTQARLPELEHLELYTGEENYGGDSSIADVTVFFNGELFPKLKYLGIKDSTYQDDIARLAVDSAILPLLEVLDLSMGTLTDEGAQALLDAKDRLSHLKKLDLNHHFISDSVAEQLAALPIEVDLSDKQQADEYDGEIYRYVSVAE